ncbi:hypothetical protein [Sphingomonas cavernae]|nr:hypothetical protein [Sphingomonas cavernae]
MRARYRMPLAALTFGLAPAVAQAACEPSLVDGAIVVQLIPSDGMDSQQLVERFHIRIRNNGHSDCALRLAVGRDLAASDNRFPNYTLTGPRGVVSLVPVAAATSNPDASVPVAIPAGAQISIPYDVRMAVGWGAEAGDYRQELQYFVLPESGREELASQRAQLSLRIPATARIRFSGAQGGNGPARIDLGTLSPTSVTTSQPFGLRVLSTSAYQVQFASQNGGALQRVDGPDRIPYRLLIGGRTLDLTGIDGISVARHTSASGDLHPLSVVVDPDPERHAGSYADRVTVTVTPI